jgi:hypothetical protein
MEMAKPGGSAQAEPSARPELLLSGVDSLYVSFYLDLSSGELDFDDLAYEKERIRHSRGNRHAEVGGERFALLPHGRRPYPYALTNKSFEVRLAEHMRPNCHVQFFSEALWKFGAKGVFGRIEQWFQSLGFRHQRPNTVSRADWAFDYHLPIIDFAWNDFVSIAEKDNSWRRHRKSQTFSFGVGSTLIRVYDKSAEIKQQSGRTWFHDLWGRKDRVWRVEFQVRRDKLDEAGIKTFEDIGAHQGDVLRELAKRHTTLKRPSGDTNLHAGRCIHCGRRCGLISINCRRRA